MRPFKVHKFASFHKSICIFMTFVILSFQIESFVKNINAVINNFKWNSDSFFCEDCFKMYDHDSCYVSMEEGHICLNNVEDVQRCA